MGPRAPAPVPRGMRARGRRAGRQRAAAADAAPGGTWTAGVRLRALGSQAWRGPGRGSAAAAGARAASAFPPRADTGFRSSCSALTRGGFTASPGRTWGSWRQEVPAGPQSAHGRPLTRWWETTSVMRRLLTPQLWPGVWQGLRRHPGRRTAGDADAERTGGSAASRRADLETEGGSLRGVASLTRQQRLGTLSAAV